MSRITTGKDKIPKISILARIFGLRQGFKDKSCPGQEIRETRTRFHPWAIQGKLITMGKKLKLMCRLQTAICKTVCRGGTESLFL